MAAELRLDDGEELADPGPATPGPGGARPDSSRTGNARVRPRRWRKRCGRDRPGRSGGGTAPRLPLDLYWEASEHQNELRREFALLQLSSPDDTSVPCRLLRLVEELDARFAAFSTRPTSSAGPAPPCSPWPPLPLRWPCDSGSWASSSPRSTAPPRRPGTGGTPRRRPSTVSPPALQGCARRSTSCWPEPSPGCWPR